MKRRKKKGSRGKRTIVRRIRKIFLWTIVLLVVLAGAITLVSYYYGNRIAKQYLISAIENGSKGLYHLKIKNLYFNVTNGRVIVSGFQLIPDTELYNIRKGTDTLSPMLIAIRADKIQVQGLDFVRLVRQKEIKARRIIIGNPEITLILNKGRNKPENGNLSISLPSKITSIQILQVLLSEGTLTIYNKVPSPQEKYSVPSLNATLDNILVDSLHRGKGRIFNTDDIHIILKGIKIKTRDKMYSIIPGEIRISTASSSFRIQDLKIIPEYSRSDFSKKLGYQSDRLNITLKGIAGRSVDFRNLLVFHKFNVGKISVEKMELDDYRDKRVPRRRNYSPPMPQQVLRESGMYIKIDTINLGDGKVTYSEQVGEHPGSVFFDRMNISILNVTNDTNLLRRNAVITVDGSMYLMGKGLTKAHINILPGSGKNAFSYSASLSNLDLREINPMLTNLEPAEILAGKLTKMIIPYVSADDDKAVGSMDFYYSDLRVRIKTNKTGTWNRIKSEAVTLAVNTYFNNNNPRENGSFTEGTIHFERDKQKGFFNFLWKSVFSGIRSTILVNKKEQKRLNNREKGK